MIRPTVPSGCTSRRVLAAAALALAVFGLGVPAGAATFTVNDMGDAVDATPGDGVCATAAGQCTLRAAIQEANALTGLDTIVVPAGTVVLTIGGTGEDAAATGDLDITEDVVIQGAGAGLTIVDGGKLDRVFDILTGTVQITGLTILNGTTAAGEGGGGIRSQGSLTLTNVTVSGNTATGATGGGILNLGTATLIDVTVSGNTASGAGGMGGIGNVGGTMTLTRVTVAGNGAPAGPGGGVVHASTAGTLTMTNATVSGNTAQGDGGGILQADAGALALASVTVAGNVSQALGGGLRRGGPGAVTIRNTILGGNTVGVFGDGPDCSGTLTSLGGNLIQDPSGCTRSGAAGEDLTGQDPRLGPLQDNGGPTPTHALLAGSPALDAGGASGCPATDQRGVARPFDGDGTGGAACDIGAYESDVASVTLTVGRAGTGTGTVTSVPAGISCGADCSESYFRMTMVTLTAAPAAGSFFVGWSGGGCVGAGSCVVTLTATTTVQATFQLRPSVALSTNQTTFTTGDRLTLSVTAENRGPAIQVDVFLAVLLPAAAGPAFGCSAGDAVVFFADNFARAVLTCASAPLSTFPPLLRGVTIPGNLPLTTLTDFFSAQLTADLSPGVSTFALVLTSPGAFAAGVRTPLALATAAVTFAP